MESVRFSGYRIFMSRSTGGPRCLITLVRATIPCSLIADPHCGDGVESLAVGIYLVGGLVKLYIVYSRPDCTSLDINQVCSTRSSDHKGRFQCIPPHLGSPHETKCGRSSHSRHTQDIPRDRSSQRPKVMLCEGRGP